MHTKNLMNARQTVVCPHVKQAMVTHIGPHVTAEAFLLNHRFPVYL